MKLVIVESPAKAKTIKHYLGSEFEVLSSMGHVRELESKSGSVVPSEQFRMIYHIIPKAQQNVTKIVSAAKKADIVYLCSDPDREGEAIAQSIVDILLEKKAIKKDLIFRADFNEITKDAVKKAIASPRQIDSDLVAAQQSRLALDYLVGFNISPILWRKLPGSRSAGRVQSVALRMIVDREFEIKKFIPQEYWSIVIEVKNKLSESIFANVVSYNDNDFSVKFPNNQSLANTITNDIKNYKNLSIANRVSKEVKRNPYPPFTTALLQQEAARKLGFGAKKTMQIAQKLYEGIDINGEITGLITYMRTDGMTINADSIEKIRQFINNQYGDEYLPQKSITYKTKAKNAQEAHEAIRPTDVNLSPNEVKEFLDKDQLRLYDLIWKRTIACQMNPAIYNRETIDFQVLCQSDAKALAVATGSQIKFDGFLKVYGYNSEDNDDNSEDENRILPKIENSDNILLHDIEEKQHFTSPPPRFTEASLIKNLEKYSIGRPSTYATIISVIQDREYVKLENKQFKPDNKGIIVTAFLKLFFKQYVEYDFTAKLEEDLDLISDGKKQRLDFLEGFWKDFASHIEEAKDIKPLDVSAKLTSELALFLFEQDEDKNLKQDCPLCEDGKLKLSFSKFGAFISCSNYPSCKYNKSIVTDAKAQSQPQDTSSTPAIAFKKEDQEITYKVGRFGPYLELIKGGVKKNCSLPKALKTEDLTEEVAFFYADLPKVVSIDKKEFTLGIGRFGPYVLHNKKFYSVKKNMLHELTNEDILTLADKN